MDSKQSNRYPIIGFVGLILVVAGLIALCQHVDLGLGLVVAGGAILVFALVTGNVKLFG